MEKKNILKKITLTLKEPLISRFRPKCFPFDCWETRHLCHWRNVQTKLYILVYYHSLHVIFMYNGYDNGNNFDKCFCWTIINCQWIIQYREIKFKKYFFWNNNFSSPCKMFSKYQSIWSFKSYLFPFTHWWRTR